MDIKQLITFTALAREKHYIKVAEHLNYAPSTLAKHVHSLEDELEAQLVEYRGGRIELTAEGRRFMPYAEEMLSVYERLQEEFNRQSAAPGCIRVAGGELMVGFAFGDFFGEMESWMAEPACRLIPSAVQEFPSGWSSMRWISALSRC